MPTLNQLLRSFSTESKAEIFTKCRKDFSLPPTINRGRFHGPREEKIGSKVGQKPAPLPPFLQFFLSLSLLVVPATTSFSTTSSTTGS
jgi:hypothetical protein